MRMSTKILLLLTLLQNYETQEVNNFLIKITDHPVLMKINGIKNFNLTIPEECKELGFCEHIPNYPYDYVSEIITLLSKANIKLHADVDPREHITQYDVEEINNSEYEDLCSSQLEIIHPQVVRDNNKWYLILNSKTNPQNYVIEKCRGNPSRPERCSGKAYFTPPFYGKCVQKYIERKMFALKPPFYDYLVSIYFPIPSCCSCEVKREYPLADVKTRPNV
ncbi:unnamed protein product, partial [Brenthis ino]